MDFWIVSLFDPTPLDNTNRGRYISIASEGNKLNHRVTYFSCTFRHAKKVQQFNETHSEKINEDYEVIFVSAKQYFKNVSIRRLLSHRGYTNNLKRIINNRPRPDVILVAYPPIFPAYYLTKWARRRGIPIIIDIIDTWPKNLLRLSPVFLRSVFRLLISPLYYQSGKILRDCSGIIGISNQNITWAIKNGFSAGRTGVFLPAVPYRDIRAKLEAFKNNMQEGESTKLKMIYAGSLGLSYDLPVIMKAAEILGKKYPGKTEFLIAGAGYQEKIVLEYVARCDNIKFLGRLDHNDLLLYYSSADIGLAQYPGDATQSITYKFFDYLSAGLPILNSLMSEMAALTDEYQVGFNNPPGDTVKLVENIEKFLLNRSLLETYKKNALALSATRGDNEVVYKELVEFLMSFK